ncbi:hypothetical protein DL93DRAFT_2166144 [Clavulina sp. PMI_390]|nr:hypothetical protein DL93DRAFT_2166144 [Clavulina sp. PMI_390]
MVHNFKDPFLVERFLDLSQLLDLLLPITSVCSRWRNVAISTGKLWTLVIINPTRSAETESQIIKIFLERSANTSIIVHLVGPHDLASEYHPGFMQLFELALPHLGRCFVFRFDYLVEPMVYNIFPLPSMAILHTIFLFGKVPNASSVTLFEDPASYLRVKDLTIFGIPVTPFPQNTVSKLIISPYYTPEVWVLPFVESLP